MSDQIRINRVKAWAGLYRLEITGLAEPIVISRQLLEKHRLKEGIVITPAQLEQLRTEAERAACDREVARLLAMREHSVGEIRTKLVRKKFADSAIKHVLKEYLDRQLLDDAHYAQVLVRRIQERNPAGRSYLIGSLRRKQIDGALAERTVDLLLDDQDQTELAVRALEKRWLRFSQFDLETARRRAYNYLSRRGIGYRAARAAFEKLYDDTNKDDDD
jgi:regulatory protein